MKVDWHFCDIGVYRCPVETHTAEIEAQRRRWTGSSDPSQTAALVFDRNYWYPWRYNEVVGVIRLYVFGSQIRGELWWRRAERLLPKPKAAFEHRGKLFELDVPHAAQSADVFDGLLEHLQREGGKKPLRGRYLDLEQLKNIGRYVDWRRMMNEG